MRLSSYIKVFAGITKSELMILYKDNRITVNSELRSLAYLVKDEDVIKIDDRIIDRLPFSYFLYYKPVGVLSDIKDSTDSYINYIPTNLKLMPCGRLDKNSEGLMILTNDGDFIDFICNPLTKAEKEYIVTLENVITNEFMENISKSYFLDNRETKPIIASKIDNLNVKMILTEGLYRQIRRIVKLNNNKVVNLKRIRIGDYYLNDMKPGDFIEIKLKL